MRLYISMFLDYQCPHLYNKCPSGGQCIYQQHTLCDGKQDCANGSDESKDFCTCKFFLDCSQA